MRVCPRALLFPSALQTGSDEHEYCYRALASKAEQLGIWKGHVGMTSVCRHTLYPVPTPSATSRNLSLKLSHQLSNDILKRTVRSETERLRAHV